MYLKKYFLFFFFFYGPPRAPRYRRSLGVVRPSRWAPDHQSEVGDYFYIILHELSYYIEMNASKNVFKKPLLLQHCARTPLTFLTEASSKKKMRTTNVGTSARHINWELKPGPNVVESLFR
jgi:hypothetical protein